MKMDDLNTLKASMDEKLDFHFEDDAVIGAINGTDYLIENVNRHLHAMISGEKWSLYRAVVNLACASLVAGNTVLRERLALLQSILTGATRQETANKIFDAVGGKWSTRSVWLLADELMQASRAGSPVKE